MEPIVTLTGTQLQAFLAYMSTALHGHREGYDPLYAVHLAVDEGGVKLKFNHRTWTRALGEVTGGNGNG